MATGAAAAVATGATAAVAARAAAARLLLHRDVDVVARRQADRVLLVEEAGRPHRDALAAARLRDLEAARNLAALGLLVRVEHRRAGRLAVDGDRDLLGDRRAAAAAARGRPAAGRA